MPVVTYRTALGASAVTYGVHNAATLAQTAAPTAATAGAVTATMRHFSTADITGPAIVRWYEDGVQVADELVIQSPTLTAAESEKLLGLHDFDPSSDTVAHVALVDTVGVLPPDPLGPGADSVTLSLGALAAGAEVWITTDAPGAQTIASGTANDVGNVRFDLDAGVTYYRWAKKPGVNFTNPSAFVAVAD